MFISAVQGHSSRNMRCFRNLVQFVRYKEREKHTWRSKNGTKSRNASHIDPSQLICNVN